MNLKIGILIREFKYLSNWQLRIIQAILNDPSLELKMAIQETEKPKGTKKNALGHLFSKISPSHILLSLQTSIEQRVFFKETFSVDKENLIHSLRLIPTIQIGELNKKRPEMLRSNVKAFIQQQDLDLLINLGLSNLSLDILKLAKYGLWDHVLGDFPSLQHERPGFSEVLHKKPSIGYALIKRSTDLNVEILDNTFFNRDWSMVQTTRIAQEGGVSVLLKNLKRLQNGYSEKKITHTVPIYEHPGLYHVLKYTTQFYKHLSGKIMQKVAFKFWGQRQECWSVFLGKDSFLENPLATFKPLEMPKDEFWADPFLFKYQGSDYVFFENFSYIKNRGKISCGKVRDQELVEIIDVLDLHYHLSFPFIFEEDGDIYIMPETSENKRLEIYRAVDFPSKWELFSTAFEGEMVADAFFFDDEHNQKWLFCNKQAAETSPMNSELFIYKTDSIKLDNLMPHVQNPVIIDATVARNGGAIFKHNNNLYRPSQRNIDGIYGRALNINEIHKLTLDEYVENTVKICEPKCDKNLIAMHHLHQTDGLYVFDACYKKK